MALLEGIRLPENRLLRSLPPEDLEALLPRLVAVDLPLRMLLHEAGEPITHVYFVQEGVVSQIAQLEDGQEVEVGLIDRTGLVGYAVALGGRTSTTEAVVQGQGHALRLTADAMRAEMARGGALVAVLLRFVLSMNTQMSQVAACNARHGLGERLARWLLMMHDRVRSDQMPVTHEFMALMLGVRRSGVTLAVGALERAGAIAHSRGSVTVLDRGRLEAASCDCYAVIRRADEELAGPA
ncbi:MAG TPA: Crp/Fnr family transcriptional regulator [Azospirillaceae bacterium]|nr:Crp/Fnr family transcriptional regulator [Azospirillaceae bacterium]